MPVLYATKDPAVSSREIEHMKLSRKVAAECVVLMENDGALPLAPGVKLALYGSGARQTIRGGTGSGDVNVREIVNIEQGLEGAGYEITTKEYLNRQDRHYEQSRKDYFAWLPIRAKELDINEMLAAFTNPFQVVAPTEITAEDVAKSDTDTAVYVISRTSGEGSDRHNRRGDYLLYAEEKQQLEELAEAYEKLIVVLNIGGVMDMSEIKGISGVNAVVLMSQLGNVGGDALADVLSGKVNPCGKLTDTWAARYEDYPSSAHFSHNDGNVDDAWYTEGIYVGYRYFDTFGIQPLYPFGYGKSYTEFSISPVSVKAEGETVRVTAKVTNVGNRYAGREVVQVYYSSPAGKLPKPYQELGGFAKTALLAPGESETVEVALSLRNMASYSPKEAAWILEEGNYVIRVGSSSRSTQTAAILTLDRCVKTKIVKNLFPDTQPPHELNYEGAAGAESDHDIALIELDADAITTEQTVYQGERQPYTCDRTETLTADDVKAGRCTLEELTAQLTIEELADLCVGTLRGSGNIVGDASYAVPGAAGDTSSVISESRKVKNIIMADGPAGLRLQPVFKTTKEGELLPGGELLGDIFVPFDPSLTEENSDTYYQYCTAIPVGWALAQSWDMSALEEIGSMVGREMEIFGVDLWLAPALNIHRNPLCGRNFEYFSEDPVVSGRAAAAITLGVQKHPGKGTTIKHFAANSQEENRYFCNSHISERAIREIYLKGFEIAVKESKPLSIMSSYNLLNGVHTANSYDLLQSVCRDEWGYEGLVMTDWFTSQEQPALTGSAKVIYPISASTGCVYAGNDLQMPGCQKNVDDLIQAVRSGEELDGFRITLADLQQSAANVIRTALRCS